jgi:hypothetical protein
MNYIYLAAILFVFSCAGKTKKDYLIIKSLEKASWNWQKKGCSGNTFSFTFSDSLQTFTIEYETAIKQSGSDIVSRTFVYDIVNIKRKEIFASLRTESRTNRFGQPVLWYIKLLDEKTFTWVRSDTKSVYGPIIRCDQ